MNAGNNTSKIAAYLRQNWFKIGIALILIFLLMKKDLTFNINLRTPVKSTAPQTEEPVQAQQKPKNKEVLSEQASQPVVQSMPEKRMFDFSLFGKKEKPTMAMDKLAKIDEEIRHNYLKRFARVAITERDKFNIPASIILANAMLHSLAGTTDMAEQNNNQFQLKCTTDWQGKSDEFDDQCYRSYENAWTSFRDHSFYVTTGDFAHLRKIDRKDYKAWAKALEKASFSTEKDVAEQLIKVIEAYQLAQLDEVE